MIHYKNSLDQRLRANNHMPPEAAKLMRNINEISPKLSTYEF